MAKCAGKIIQSFIAETCFLQKTECVIIKLCKKRICSCMLLKNGKDIQNTCFFIERKKRKKASGSVQFWYENLKK